MDPERFQQIDKLLEEALEREPDQRKPFLEQACAGDVELRKEVEALLVAHDMAGSFVERPALNLAAQALAHGQGQSLIGTRLGPYEILSLLGRGGMGEVYRVRDTRLDRIDALKILPPEVATDPDRLRRFVREAKAASALNHPNIATIYEIGESDGIHWIAMELVEGQTLAERLKRNALAPDEILDIGIQAAEALEEAHSKGITHRDIKPANLMLTSKGQVKVLDFGLAKITRVEGQGSALVASTDSQTFPGLVMGTARYMSPEQVLGQPVDHRTDIFSLGVVLYEMAAGQHPFAGESPSAIFEAILHQTPTWPARVQARIPEELRRIIQKALEKFCQIRYPTASDLGTDLKRLKHELDREQPIAQPAGVAQPSQSGYAIVPRKKNWSLALAGLLGLFVVSAVILWFGKSRSAVTPEAPLAAIPLTSYQGSEEGASFSPDGSQVAFAWNGEKEDNWDIYVKVIGSEPPLRLTTNPAPDQWPAWSPDGRQIAFCRDLGGGKRAVVLISPLGGAERILTEGFFTFQDVVTGPFLSWSPDGRALATVEQANLGNAPEVVLYMMETGEKIPLTKATKPFLADSCPAFSPDGRTLAFCRWIAWANNDLYLLVLSRDLKPVGEPRRLTSDKLPTSGLTWVADGSALVYSAGSNWFIAGGNLWRVAVSGTSKPKKLTSLGQGAYSPAISPRGSRLAYTHSTFDNNIWRMEISSPQGKANPPTKFISSTLNEWLPQYSPDGKKIAFSSDRSGSEEIWVCDANRLNAIQLTHFGKGNTVDHRWSPDSSHLAFDSNSEGHPEVYVMNASGGNPRRLTSSSGSENPSWSHDGRWIYFNLVGGGIQRVPAEGGPAVVLGIDKTLWGPVESLDGKFIYLTGKGTDSSNLGLWRVSVEGGETKQVLDSLANAAPYPYAVVDDGVYFIPRPDPAKGSSI
jgi:Tol biopolymer transport system component/serine/threonine protein kinase